MRLLRSFMLLAGLALPTAALIPALVTATDAVEDKKDDLPAPLGTRITDITLTDAVTGKPWSLAEHGRDAKAVVVLFMGTECPVNNAYAPKLATLHDKYKSKGVVFVGINSNEQDDVSAVKTHAETYKLPFPVLKDEQFKLAEKFTVQRIPEAFVLDGQRFVRYRGKIDDQYTPIAKREKATSRELLDALDAVLEGKEVKNAATTPAGCLLGRSKTPLTVAPGEAITYTKHIAPLIQTHCQSCHRPGEVGPFKLMKYKDAAAWADNIKEVVTDGRMPPWHADPNVGHFSNSRRLSDQEKKTLITWIDQGCIQGDPKDEPAPKSYTEGWMMGKPDVVLAMPEPVKIPASAGPLGMPYQYIQVGDVFKEDTWVQAAEARPGNRELVHHIIAYIMPPADYHDPEEISPEKLAEMRKQFAQQGGQQQQRGNSKRGGPPGGWTNLARAFLPNNNARMQQRRPTLDGIGQGMLVAYAPGDQPTVLQPGQAKLIPKGSTIVLQMHYTPNGKAGTDRSSIGLIFAKEPPKHVVRTRAVANPRFEIPPGAANYEVKATRAFEKDAVIISFLPHMHYRGKSFKYELVYPDGKRETVLDVPKYDFNWQTTYELSKPLRVPAGVKLECTAFYDNSKDNPFNPNPRSTVYWGEQTWEEMMIGFLDYYFVQ
ncbi:MAG: redoxin domain-containing protein [Planctomycetia bacterium]|nr:redoxin domain-containing protein [Planctomycetia bacterium]